MKILFDTDISSDIDDALALLLILHLRDVDLLGVTTVYGNVALRAKVAREILRADGRSAPVRAGVGIPMQSQFPIWHSGTEGIEILDEEQVKAPLRRFGVGEDAAGFLVDQVQNHPGEITLISLGALTNVAHAMQADPRFATSLKRLVFMGAGVTYDKPMPVPLVTETEYFARASHNVRCDSEAAQRVFASEVQITVLTNDVTSRLWWDGEAVQLFCQSRTPAAVRCVAKLLKVWLEYRSELFGEPITGTCPHDALTVAEAVKPGCFVDYTRGWIKVLPDGATTFTVDPNGPHQAGVDVNAGNFFDWFNPRMLLPEAAITGKGC